MDNKHSHLRDDVARAICHADEQNGGPPWEYVEQLGKHAIEAYYDRADAALTVALSSAGEGNVGHVLYKTGDMDAPDVIKDRNGEVVLGLCRVCNKGEIELSQPCSPHLTAPLPHMGGVSVKDALAQLSDAIAREEKEREASDQVFATLRVNIEKSEPTAEFAEALRDYWLKEGKPALARSRARAALGGQSNEA